MELYQKVHLIIFLALSVAIPLLVLAWAIGRAIKNRSLGWDRIPVSAKKRLFMLSIALFGAALCIRLASEFFALANAGGKLESPAVLVMLERVVNSFLGTVRSFGADEMYNEYIGGVRAMWNSLVGENAWLGYAHTGYASVVSLFAPVAGGALIFEILADIFPRIKLVFCHLLFWREKRYFSELNEASLALAKNMRENERVKCASCRLLFKHPVAYVAQRLFALKSWLCRPVLIFTDAYLDDESEKSSELLMEAKAVGAICLRDDLTHLKKNRFGKRKYFLIDECEASNLQVLSDLSDSYNRQYLKDSEMYLFVQEDLYVQVQERFFDQVGTDVGNTLKIWPVRVYRNLAVNLLAELPLFEPLIGTDKQELNVTILGTGQIGTQLFLTTYWMGQILGRRLNITVVSKEPQKAFYDRIRLIAPELLPTTKENDDCLKLDPEGSAYNPPYANVTYKESDVSSEEFLQAISNKQDVSPLANTDYFMVALGSDEENLKVAEVLRRRVGERCLRSDAVRKTVVAYAVYDSTLCEMLNKKHIYAYGENAIYMQAFGALRDTFSMRNVFMQAHEKNAQKVGQKYLSYGERGINNDKLKGDEYSVWADLARAAHVEYKMFSAGLCEKSVFDGEGARKEDRAQAESKYEAMATIDEAHRKEKDHELAWLEHRRWNAFMRVNGFRLTKKFKAIYAAEGAHKSLTLKLHPCLVESRMGPLVENLLSDEATAKVNAYKQDGKRNELDLLDVISYDVWCMKRGTDDEKNAFDFKKYDYPAGDFYRSKLTLAEAAKLCLLPKWWVRCLWSRHNRGGLFTKREKLVILEGDEWFAKLVKTMRQGME